MSNGSRVAGFEPRSPSGTIAAAALIAHTERSKSDPAYKAAHVKTTLQIAAVMPLVYALAWAWMAILACFV